MKAFLGLFLLTISASGQWQYFIDRHGDAPPQDLINPMHDIILKTKWYAEVRPSLEKYALLVMIELNCRDFQTEEVTYSLEKNLKNSPWGWGFGASVSRGGLVINFLIQENYPYIYSPKQFADKVERDWAQYRESLVYRPWEVQNYESFVKVLDWKKMFLWEPAPAKCEAVFVPGSVCFIDIENGQIGIKTIP